MSTFLSLSQVQSLQNAIRQIISHILSLEGDSEPSLEAKTIYTSSNLFQQLDLAIQSIISHKLILGYTPLEIVKIIPLPEQIHNRIIQDNSLNSIIISKNLIPFFKYLDENSVYIAPFYESDALILDRDFRSYLLQTLEQLNLAIFVDDTSNLKNENEQKNFVSKKNKSVDKKKLKKKRRKRIVEFGDEVVVKDTTEEKKVKKNLLVSKIHESMEAYIEKYNSSPPTVSLSQQDNLISNYEEPHEINENIIEINEILDNQKFQTKEQEDEQNEVLSNSEVEIQFSNISQEENIKISSDFHNSDQNILNKEQIEENISIKEDIPIENNILIDQNQNSNNFEKSTILQVEISSETKDNYNLETLHEENQNILSETIHSEKIDFENPKKTTNIEIESNLELNFDENNENIIENFNSEDINQDSKNTNIELHSKEILEENRNLEESFSTNELESITIEKDQNFNISNNEIEENSNQLDNFISNDVNLKNEIDVLNETNSNFNGLIENETPISENNDIIENETSISDNKINKNDIETSNINNENFMVNYNVESLEIKLEEESTVKLVNDLKEDLNNSQEKKIELYVDSNTFEDNIYNEYEVIESKIIEDKELKENIESNIIDTNELNAIEEILEEKVNIDDELYTNTSNLDNAYNESNQEKSNDNNNIEQENNFKFIYSKNTKTIIYEKVFNDSTLTGLLFSLNNSDEEIAFPSNLDYSDPFKINRKQLSFESLNFQELLHKDPETLPSEVSVRLSNHTDRLWFVLSQKYQNNNNGLPLETSRLAELETPEEIFGEGSSDWHSLINLSAKINDKKEHAGAIEKELLNQWSFVEKRESPYSSYSDHSAVSSESPGTPSSPISVTSSEAYISKSVEARDKDVEKLLRYSYSPSIMKQLEERDADSSVDIDALLNNSNQFSPETSFFSEHIQDEEPPKYEEIQKSNRNIESIPEFSSNTQHMKMFIDPQPPKLSRSKLFTLQKGLCASCGKDLKDSIGLFRKPRLCYYSKRLYCKNCHQNEKALIPARVLHSWDFKKYHVSKAALDYLNAMEKIPCLCVSAINPLLFDQVPNLRKARKLRYLLVKQWETIKDCPSSGILLKRLHLDYTNLQYVMDTEMYSIDNLDQLSKPLKSSPFLRELASLFYRFNLHIMEQCHICGNKCRETCAWCKKQEPLYRFQLKNAVECPTCHKLFHMTCFRNLRTGSIACPYCSKESLPSQSSQSENLTLQVQVR